ncbi:MAG: SGNH/GDSL hydrolase family protein [Arthrobacter sp.]
MNLFYGCSWLGSGGVMDGSSLRVLATVAAGAALLLVGSTACTPASAERQATFAQPILTARGATASGMALPASDSDTAAKSDTVVKVVVIGDSLSTGYGTSPDQAWPQLLQQVHVLHTRPVQVTNAAENGSGYLVPGEYGNTFTMEVDSAVTADADVVVFFGSDNDWGTDPEELRNAAAKTFAAASALAPEAVLVAVGPLSGSDEPDPVLADVRDSAASAARNAGVEFIDPIADQWLKGRAGVLLGPDGEHPSAAGQEFLRDKMKQILSAATPG